jgi:hypothetical protein
MKEAAKEDRPPLDKVPAIGVSYTITLDEKRAIVMQTHIDGEAPLAEINQLLDKLGAAGDRQELRYRLEKLDKEIAEHESALTRIDVDMAAMDATHAARADGKRNKTLGDHDRVARENAVKTRGKWAEELARRLKERERIEKIIAA